MKSVKELSGWTGKILQIDLSTGSSSTLPVTSYKECFIGGRGLASRLYWDVMDKSTSAFDRESHLFFMSGPLCGTPAPAASRWIVAGKSPMTYPEQYASGNLGGRFGAALKWAGFDGIAITGASQKPAILVIEAKGKCSLSDASQLWGRDAFETISLLQGRFGGKASVITIGKAGEMRVRFANIIGSGGISATKGFGAVMGSKNLKAVVITAPKRPIPVAQPEKLAKIKKEIAALIKGEESGKYWQEVMIEDVTKVKSAYCYGCPGVCRRGIYEDKQHKRGYRKTCVSAFFYANAERAKSGSMAQATFDATQLANRHGLCTLELRFLVTWLPQALKKGIINPKETGMDPEDVGTSEWIEKMVSLIVNRQGIGELLAEGSRRAAIELKAEALLNGMVRRTGFDADLYNPRLFLSTAPIYATEPVFPITQLHEVSFPMVEWMVWMGTEGMMGFLDTQKLRRLARLYWGSEEACQFDSQDHMGEAAAIIQNRSYAKENFILCDWFWTKNFSANLPDGVIDPSLEARLFSAVTEYDMDEQAFLLTGERCANLSRAISLREGHQGRVDDTLEEFNFSKPLQRQDPPVGLFNPELMLPGKGGKLISRMGKTVKRDIFQKVMDNYYMARGWEVTSGLPTRERLKKLGIDELIPVLEKQNLIV